MCCCLPCVKWVRERFKLDSRGFTNIVISEIVRWIIILVPVYLSVWRYVELRGPSAVLVDKEEVFWTMVTLVILLISACAYLPFKILGLSYRMRRNALRDNRWRPSILMYILVCALPCLIIVLVAIENSEEEMQTLDSSTTAVLQILVLGLTFTEWMAKLREEEMTYDLITAMSLDFFFAYDVIAFIMMCTHEAEVFNSAWLYVCFGFAFVAMFKYIPNQPVSIKSNGAPKGAATVILVTMFCNDIPFVVVRLSTLVMYGFEVSDLIYPVKNIGMIFFGATQLYIMYANKKLRKANQKARFSENRVSKYPGTWSDDAEIAPISDKNSPGENTNDGEIPKEQTSTKDNSSVMTINSVVDDSDGSTPPV